MVEHLGYGVGLVVYFIQRWLDFDAADEVIVWVGVVLRRVGDGEFVGFKGLVGVGTVGMGTSLVGKVVSGYDVETVDISLVESFGSGDRTIITCDVDKTVCVLLV